MSDGWRDIPELMLYPEWELERGATASYHQVPPSHLAHAFIQRTLAASPLPEAVRQARERKLTSIAVPVVYCSDPAGQEARAAILEPRLLVRGTPFEHRAFDQAKEVYTTDVVLICYPVCSRLLRQTRWDDAKRPFDFQLRRSLASELAVGPKPTSTEPVTPLHFQVETQVWQAELEHQAWRGLEQLFHAMSLSEELWRLHEILEHVPYFMEGTERLARLRKLLDTQVGHLGLGEDARAATRQWYAEGSPPAGVDADWVKVAAASLPVRLLWLIEQCERHGYRRVAELGAVEGLSLFHLIQHAPHIEWHGFEVNKKAVEAGHALAKQANLAHLLHLHHVDELDRVHGSLDNYGGPFDAVALFEVLEHNTPEVGAGLLRAAYHCVRPGGRVYLTTPFGNWSGFDLRTRDLALRKDHILAFTPERMVKAILGALGPLVDEVGAQHVENPNAQEANGWVFASMRRIEERSDHGER